MAHNLKRLARYSRDEKWTNMYLIEKVVTQMIPTWYDEPPVVSDDVADKIIEKAMKNTFPPTPYGLDAYTSEKMEHVERTSLCSLMIFAGEAMAPAITCKPRFGAGGVGAAAAAGAGAAATTTTTGGESTSGEATTNNKPPLTTTTTTTTTYNMLMVRQLMYPEFVSTPSGVSLADMPFYSYFPSRSWFTRRANVGDVVAFTHPNPVDPSVPGGLLVRRVVALEGDVMESSVSGGGGGGGGGGGSEDGEGAEAGVAAGVAGARVETSSGDGDDDGEGEEFVETFVIPKDHAWVLADNDDIPHVDVPDSRTFGPVHLSNVVGRVVYSVRSATDHGVVHNSSAASAVDQPVLHAELDVELMAEELEDFATGTRTFRRVTVPGEEEDDDEDDDW